MYVYDVDAYKFRKLLRSWSKLLLFPTNYRGNKWAFDRKIWEHFKLSSHNSLYNSTMYLLIVLWSIEKL